MASGYIFEVSEKLPDAVQVLDHFHIVKWFNDKLTQLRRDLYREAKGICKDVLKVVRWLLLKKPQDLKTHRIRKKDEKKRLQQALKFNQPLATAYYMKERLRLMFNCGSIEEARDELTAWCQDAENSGIAILKKAARQVLIWKTLILNWYKYPINSAKLEGTNAKIRTLQKRAYGYRDKQYFKLRLFNLHNINPLTTSTYKLQCRTWVNPS